MGGRKRGEQEEGILRWEEGEKEISRRQIKERGRKRHKKEKRDRLKIKERQRE